MSKGNPLNGRDSGEAARHSISVESEVAQIKDIHVLIWSGKWFACLVGGIEVVILENWVQGGMRKRQILDFGEWAQNVRIFVLHINAQEKLSAAE